MQIKPMHYWMLVAYIPVFVWSAINPYDRFTWFLEILPGILGIALIVATYNRFRFSDMSYWIMWIYLIILSIGAKYTYTHVPFFDYLRDVFDWSRNNYDKVGHFYLGFGPAMLMREIYMRFHAVKRGFWMKFVITLALLGLAAIYEILEWWIAIGTGITNELFIGAQGDVWDTQKDMFATAIGSTLSLMFLTKFSDRSIAKLYQQNPKDPSSGKRFSS